jgi:putative flippase GtrA
MLKRMGVAGSSRAARRARRGERFTAVMVAITSGLPFGLARIVPPSMLGFALLSAVTFAVNLVLLIGLHGGLGWPVPASITLAYLAGAWLGYVLNRWLNFRSHSAVAPQAGVYAAVAIVNYLAWILGVGAGLAAVGVDYRLARFIAGVCEFGYMYAAMHWLVFRDVRGPAGGPAGPDRDRGGPS